MADAQANNVNFTDIAHQCRHARDDDLKDLFKKNEGAIKKANLRERKIARVGMPVGHRLDSWSDEIPVVCEIKKAVQWVGGTAGCIWLGLKIKQVFFG